MGNLLSAFAAIWLFLAIFEIGGGDKISAYVERVIEGRHNYYVSGIYSVHDTFVVAKHYITTTKYEDCVIFDRENWKCTFKDRSGSVSFVDGIYEQETNTVKYPHLSYMNDLWGNGVSRRKYLFSSCYYGIRYLDYLMLKTCVVGPFLH